MKDKKKTAEAFGYVLLWCVLAVDVRFPLQAPVRSR